jgi:hypothetical protein
VFKRYPIGSCKTELGGGNVFLYKYFLTESQKDIFRGNGWVNVMAYGIEATCEKIMDGSIIKVYTDAIECVSPNREKVLELIEFLRRHEVSPIHLIDIAGPFVDDCVESFEMDADILMETVVLV